ncbi:glycosyltransferase [Flavobacterium sp.]|uniref:glycosyltransferase n=1 Tax=Flavobacterium sp. TaxID=239 RepID=UPI00261E4CCF|nr:glycosyltransferase [Flavobacterium sp.]MDG2431248.1 glycosyltransferase [Flavobacterium sp.]
MKILQIINSLATGGAEKLLLETLPLYKEKGLQMDVLVLNGTNHPFLQALKELNCCTIYSLGAHSVYNPLYIIKIIPYLKKYELIHVHLFPAQYWVVFAKAIGFSKVKLIFTEHNSSNRRLTNRLFRIIDRMVYRFYQQVVCISSEIQSIIHLHTDAPIVKLPIIKNGVNLSAIKQAKAIERNQIDKNLTELDTIIIQVAGFREQKDQATLIRSLTHLPSEVKLLLVGEGAVKNECESLVQSLGLQERILFLGLRMDVPQLLKSADVIVLSSKYEGLSLSSIEGMASERPFVASDVPGLSEVVKGAGVLFPVGDEIALAREISKLLKDSDYFEAVVTACLERAAAYDITIMVDKHIDLYKRLAKS